MKTITKILSVLLTAVFLSAFAATAVFAENGWLTTYVYKHKSERGTARYGFVENGELVDGKAYGEWVPFGTEVFVRATPNEGYKFVEWLKWNKDTKSYDSVSKDTEYIFKITDENTLYARFDDDSDDPVEIKSIDFDVKMPVVGKEIENVIKAPKGISAKVEWYKTTDSLTPIDMGDDRVAHEGSAYTMRVFFECDYGYKISDYLNKASVNGVEYIFSKQDAYTYAIYKTKKFSPLSSEENSETPEAKFGEPIKWLSASDWAEAELDKANAAGLIPDIFSMRDLTRKITRLEFAHVAVKLYDALSGEKAVVPSGNPFDDTDDAEVLKAYDIGITKGTSDKEFSPGAFITREEMAVMLVRALKAADFSAEVDISRVERFDDDKEMHDWGKKSIYYMSEEGLILGMGDGSFGVSGTATREQAILILERAVEKYHE